MAKTKIIGTGVYFPGEPIDNIELKKLANIDFDHEKIENKIGIKKRHIAKLRNIDETTADFATKATESAIKDADIEPDDIDLFIVGTDTPEFISPATSIILQGRIQKKQKYTGSFDVCASCASFTSALDAASRMMMTDDGLKYAAVTGVYNMPAYVRDGDSFGYSIFADGAGCVILKKVENDDKSEYINGQLLSDGTQWNFVGVYTGGTRKPVTKELLDKEEFGLQLIQPLPGSRNINLWPPIVKRLVEKSGKKVKDIEHIIFTQINKYVIEEVMKILELPMDKTTTIMDKYGYTGSSCVPVAFHHALKENRIKRGDLVVFIASGAGLAVGANMFVY